MRILVGLLTLSTLFFACSEDEKVQSECVAGKGGALAISLFPQHHGKAIVNLPAYLDTAYIKYNTQDFPGTSPSKYDLIVAGTVGENHIHLMNMKCGSYYIYMAGFDSTVMKRVVGGVPFSTTKQTGEVEVIVPVTE